MELAVPGRYRLDCVDCPFRSTVEGDYDAVLAEVEAHQEDVEAGPADHFVNVHRLD